MKSILQELYMNGLAPSERPAHYLAERTRLREAHFALYEELTAHLDDERRQKFDAFIDRLYEEHSLGDCEAFIDGFRLGARVMLEVFSFPAGKS